MLRRETQRGRWKFTCGALLALASVPALALLGQGEHVWAALARPPAAAPEFAGFAEYVGATHAFDPFTGPLLRSVAPHATAILLLLLVAARLAAVLARAGGSPRAAEERGAESGASVIEFALVLPLLLIILLLVLQIALLVQAKFMVNYAAFCAARSAVVTIPAKIYSQRTGRYEKPNTLQLNSPLSPKMNIIRRAAALPCVAISPVLNPTVWRRTGTSIADFPAYAGTFTRMGLLFPFEAEGGIVPLELFKRASYAYDDENTTVEVVREGGQAGQQGGTVIVNGQVVTQSRDVREHELITVRVTFRYYLTAPGVNRMLGEPYRPGLLGFFLGTGFYYPISEQYTLPLEGERLFPPDQEPRDQREVETELYD